MAELSKTLDRFQPSMIAQIFALAAEMKRQGKQLVDFSTGEPDFDTPENIKNAGIEAIRAGETKYTEVQGSAALREAIAAKFVRDNKLKFELDEIVVGSGAKPLLSHAFAAMLDAGDEVVIPTPCWPSHPGAVLLNAGTPVFLETEAREGFKITPERLRKAISSKTKCVLMCSPSNPAGVAYAKDELQDLGEILLDHPDIWIISDDLYEHVIFDEFPFCTMAEAVPGLASRTLTVNGVSKAYAMTGWRIGYAGGPKDLVAGIIKVMSQATGSPPTMAQAAAIEALNGDQCFLHEAAQAYQRRRDNALRILNQVEGLLCTLPEGGFYLFPDFSRLIGRKTANGSAIKSSVDFARYLLEDWGAVVVPGSAFEAEGCFRISIATSDEDLEKGCQLIAKACAELK